ncbi:MAG: VWA domain-containing protein [Bryobacteraceae bacterium]
MLDLRSSAGWLICSAILAFSQDTSPEIASHDAPATFNTKVNLVSVPVVVRDGKGHSIGTLKKEDFQLFDKGKPQIISKFTIETAEGRVAPLEVTAADPDLEKGAAKAPAGPPPANRFVAYLFDDMHASFGDLAQARAAAIKHLADTMKGTDRAAVYTTSGQNALDFTDDREKLAQTMNLIRPRSRFSSTQCPDITPYLADLIVNKNDPTALGFLVREAVACGIGSGTDTAAQALQMATTQVKAMAPQVLGVAEADSQIALSVLKAVVQRLSVMPGQRTIVLISPGFLVTINHRQEEAESIDRAIRANVVISALDARGLYTITPGGDASTANTSVQSANTKTRYQGEAAVAQSDVLAELADGTGGTFFHNNNDLQEGFRRTAAAPEFMYVLGFSPQNLKSDGSFHSLKVVVVKTTATDMRGTSVQARRGYYAPRHSTTPAEDAKEEIRVALFSREEMSDIPADLHMQFFKATDQNAKLSVVAHVDLKHLRFKKGDGRNRNTLAIVSAVFDRNGVMVGVIQKEVEMKFKDDRLEKWLEAGVTMKTSFDVRPGSYVVRLVVRDSEGQAMAARNGVVEIP